MPLRHYRLINCKFVKMIQSLKQKPWIMICLIGLLARLAFLPFSHVVDPDVFSRIYISWEWLQKPQFNKHSSLASSAFLYHVVFFMDFTF